MLAGRRVYDVTDQSQQKRARSFDQGQQLERAQYMFTILDCSAQSASILGLRSQKETICFASSHWFWHLYVGLLSLSWVRQFWDLVLTMSLDQLSSNITFLWLILYLSLSEASDGWLVWWQFPIFSLSGFVMPCTETGGQFKCSFARQLSSSWDK